jgi:hypothetical protein
LLPQGHRTYQEGICSRRRLVFTTEQVLFECNAADLHEAVARPFFDHDQLPLERLAKHNDVVHEYWNTAMAPITFRPEDDIPRPDFLHASVQAAFGFTLLWNVLLKQQPDQRGGFPSWSWAGWIAPVK